MKIVETHIVSNKIVALPCTKCLFQPCIDYVDVVGRSYARGYTITIQYAKMAIFWLSARKYRKW